MKTRSTSRSPAIGRSIETPRPPLPEGKVYCGSCGGVTSLTKNRHLRAHKTPRGYDCGQRISGYEPPVAATPRPEPKPATRKPVSKRATKKPAPYGGLNGNLLPVTGHCHQCDRRITGERKFCGPCLVARGTA